MTLYLKMTGLFVHLAVQDVDCRLHSALQSHDDIAHQGWDLYTEVTELAQDRRKLAFLTPHKHHSTDLY